MVIDYKINEYLNCYKKATFAKQPVKSIVRFSEYSRFTARLNFGVYGQEKSTAKNTVHAHRHCLQC